MPNINTLLDHHVVLKYEFVDRIFLNGCVSRLQTSDDLAWFLCHHQGQRLPRYELLGEMTQAFVAAIEALATRGGIPPLHLEKGQSKEAAARPFFDAAAQSQREGVVLIGIAQESVKVFRPPTRQQRQAQKFAGQVKAYVIQRFFDRWLYRLPNPFTHRDRRAGHTYQLSLLQLEVSRTEVFDRPLHGGQFFEEVIKDHIDLGRPEQMKLVFGCRIQRRRGAAPPAPASSSTT